MSPAGRGQGLVGAWPRELRVPGRSIRPWRQLALRAMSPCGDVPRASGRRGSSMVWSAGGASWVVDVWRREQRVLGRLAGPSGVGVGWRRGPQVRPCKAEPQAEGDLGGGRAPSAHAGRAGGSKTVGGPAERNGVWTARRSRPSGRVPGRAAVVARGAPAGRGSQGVGRESLAPSRSRRWWGYREPGRGPGVAVLVLGTKRLVEKQAITGTSEPVWPSTAM